MTTFEVRRDRIEVTSDGTLGIPPDVMRRFYAGMPRFFIDDVEVDEAEFVRRRAESQADEVSERRVIRLPRTGRA